MIRVVLLFALVFLAFFFGINAFRSMTKKAKWELTKIAGYSILCAVLSMLVLISIVVIF